MSSLELLSNMGKIPCAPSNLEFFGSRVLNMHEILLKKEFYMGLCVSTAAICSVPAPMRVPGYLINYFRLGVKDICAHSGTAINNEPMVMVTFVGVGRLAPALWFQSGH